MNWNWKRLIPVAIILIAAGAFFGTGLHQRITFDTLALNYDAQRTIVEENPLLAYSSAIALYVLAVSVAFPAAWIITVAYGVIFGWIAGSLVVVVSATIGACILYLAARTLAEDFFRKKAGNWLNKMAAGFRENAVNYMLALRLTPIAPFLLVNAVPGVLGVPFRIFAWTTAVGIIPGTLAYVSAGEGLRSIVAERANACVQNVAPCGEALKPSDLVTPQILIAISLLAIVSLIPVFLKWLQRRRNVVKPDAQTNSSQSR